MIVKTGANYQANGGYIEASRDGNIITIDGAEYNNKYGVHSMAKFVVDNRTNTDEVLWAGVDGSQTVAPAYYSRTIEANTRKEFQAFKNQTIVCSTFPITLSDESVGCEVRGAQRQYIYITDVDAVAVITNLG